ncbi:MAG: helix-turn-helix domain-containing protein [Chitinophagaceae bacterium]|nr:helix-turn-helix domain-containing protein [Chitinophagaceae bacterium]
MSSFEDRLVKVIKDSGLSQKEFAKKVGVTEQGLGNYLNGRYPKVDVLIRMKQMFNFSIDWMLTGLEAKPVEADLYILEIQKELIEYLKEENAELKKELGTKDSGSCAEPFNSEKLKKTNH